MNDSSLNDGNPPKNANNLSSSGQIVSPFIQTSSSDEDGESGENSSLGAPQSQQRSQGEAIQGESALTMAGHRKNNEAAATASKVCRVCGDKALGYNFNVISCESCKAFFRRNALKKKEFACPFSSNCDVTYVSRRFCQKCRLRKCFEVGMNPDWIMSDDVLAAKRRRRMESGNASLEKIGKISPETRKIVPVYPRISSVEPILITANTTDGLSVLANCASSTPAVQQQQFALLNTQGGPKVITIVPVQQLPQVASRANIDKTSGAVYCVGSPSPANIIVAGTNVTSPNSSVNIPTSIASSIQNLTTAVKSEDETINIPKNVLINLITKCHSGNDVASIDRDAMATATSTSSGSSQRKNPPGQCSCKCTCGAKSDNDPIGIEKSDKMISTDDLPPTNGFLRSQCGRAFSDTPPSSAATSTVFGGTSSSPLDFISGGLTRGCRVLPQQQIPALIAQHQQQGGNRQQQSMYEDVLDAAIISVFHDVNGYTGVSNFGMENGESSCCAGLYRQLNPIERQRLEELLAANEVMKEPLEGLNEQRIYEGHNVDPKLMDVINMTDIAVRRIIKMNKRIEAFRNLCQGDQIALLKGGCTELMILRGIMTYDPEKDSWLTRVHNTGHEYIKLEVLKGVKGNVYEEHKKYVQSFPAAWRTSEPIMIILGAIALFSPGRPNIVHKEMIKLEQQFYYELLKNFLATIYDPQEAKAAYSGLLDRLGTLHRVNEFAASIFLDINPKDVEPLLIEIFDLKK